jgi:hypothetical protein
LSYILYHWPFTAPRKELYFIAVCRDLLSIFISSFTQEMATCLLQTVSKSILSLHSDTALAAIDFIRSESSDIIRAFPSSLPPVLTALKQAGRCHWDEAVRADADYQLARLARFSLPAQPAAPDDSNAKWRALVALAQSRGRLRR